MCIRDRTGLVFLLDTVHDGARHIDRQAAAVHRDLRLIIPAHVRDGLRAGDLARLEILHEQTAHRVGPQRSIEEVARADGVDLDVVRAQLERERLRQADAAEFGARVGKILVGAFQTGLGVQMCIRDSLNEIHTTMCD